jgi:hypothetical protein
MDAAAAAGSAHSANPAWTQQSLGDILGPHSGRLCLKCDGTGAETNFVFQRNGRVDLNRRGRRFSRLLAGDLRTSACRVCTARASLCSAVM